MKCINRNVKSEIMRCHLVSVHSECFMLLTVRGNTCVNNDSNTQSVVDHVLRKVEMSKIKLLFTSLGNTAIY